MACWAVLLYITIIMIILLLLLCYYSCGVQHSGVLACTGMLGCTDVYYCNCINIIVAVL